MLFRLSRVVERNRVAMTQQVGLAQAYEIQAEVCSPSLLATWRGDPVHLLLFFPHATLGPVVVLLSREMSKALESNPV